ncbi:MAG TPA: hypothetical protein VLB81_05085 [Gaiellales bacterium]|nr:hypothetical protein [Gaiellales bacterium]
MILQLQVPVDSLRREALLRARGAEMSVVDARTGVVLFTNAQGRDVATPLAGPDLHEVRKVTRTGRSAGLFDVGGRRVAYVHMNPSAARTG